MNPLTATFFAGLFYFLAGAFGLVRHLVLEPAIPNYPKAPQWLLHIVFAFAVILIYAGLRFLWVWGTGEGSTVPPGATGFGVLLAFGTMMYKGAMLGNVLHQRYPADVWTRLNRINTLVRCSKKGS